jgi:uncharacterized protein YheU (UPF0270 family)
VESFVLREGTDYGAKEFSLDEKVAHVVRQLERGDVKIVFDLESQTVHIVVAGSRSTMPTKLPSRSETKP